jgi:AcrR family transcriptional regulator
VVFDHVLCEHTAERARRQGSEPLEVDGPKAPSLGQRARRPVLPAKDEEQALERRVVLERAIQDEDVVEPVGIQKEAKRRPRGAEPLAETKQPTHDVLLTGGAFVPRSKSKVGPARDAGHSRSEISIVARRAKAKPRKSPRQERSRALVDALLTAASRVLVEDGYERLTTARVADVAGVSIGSFYQYFPSKEALVGAVVRRLSTQMIEEFQVGLAELVTAPLEVAVRGCIERAASAFSLDPPLRKVIVEQVPDASLLTRTTEFDDSLIEIFQGYFEFHRDRIRPKNVRLAAVLVHRAVEAMAGAAIVNAVDDAARAEAIDEMTAMVLGYLRA